MTATVTAFGAQYIQYVEKLIMYYNGRILGSGSCACAAAVAAAGMYAVFRSIVIIINLYYGR